MSLEDTFIRRQVFIERFSSSQGRDAQRMLERLYKQLNARILASSSDFEMNRLNLIRERIAALLAEGFRSLGQHLSDNAMEFAQAEMNFSAAAMQQNTKPFLSIPSLVQLEAAVLNKGMDTPIGVGRLTLNEAIAQFVGKKSANLMAIVNDGVLLGDTAPVIARNIMAEYNLKHKRQVKTLVKTMINHTSAMARKTIAVQNAALLEGEEWVATLDSNTTLICAGRDGRVYPVGRGSYPPAHWNCRSVRVPVIKDEFADGSQFAQRPQIAAAGRGTTTSKTKFDGWLRRQPAEFQNEYFSQFPQGLEKAKLFRAGVKIDRFRDESGVNFTLEQLQSLEPVAFGKAGIDI